MQLQELWSQSAMVFFVAAVSVVALALAGLGMLTTFALVRQGIRAFAPVDKVGGLVESLSSYETVFCYLARCGQGLVEDERGDVRG